jgi:oligoendopeptidase F
MHTWYSAKHQPYLQYNYTIFEAEVASTFNEVLLAEYLFNKSHNDQLKTYIIYKRLEDLLATLFRQTMFAEYELKTYTMYESGEALTVESIRQLYRQLLEKYFGPAVELLPESDLEALRIPHFYEAFYVYKYATGVSAALALAKGVMEGDETKRHNYFKFLKSGGSRFPLESLKLAGVDMSSPAPVEHACQEFERLLDILEHKLAIL